MLLGEIEPSAALAILVTPGGAIHVRAGGVDEPADGLTGPARAQVTAAFAKGSGHGLLYLGAADLTERQADLLAAPLAPGLAFLRELGRAFVSRLCATPELEDVRERVTVAPPADELERLAAAVPPMAGAEYVTVERLTAWWGDLEAAFRVEIATHDGPVQEWLRARSPGGQWSLVGRVCLHLAENRGEGAEERPFAFLATYTTRLSARSKPQHVPLARALSQSAERKDRGALLSLLVPVQRAAEGSPLVAALLASGDLYEALAWTPVEAHAFLKEIPLLERAGVIVRVPDWWHVKRPPRPEVTVRVGGKPPAGARLDTEALLDFNVSVSLGGDELTPAELKAGASWPAGRTAWCGQAWTYLRARMSQPVATDSTHAAHQASSPRRLRVPRLAGAKLSPRLTGIVEVPRSVPRHVSEVAHAHCDLPVMRTLRVPDWWHVKRPPRPEVTVRVGGKPPAGARLDTEALLDFNVSVSLGGDELTPAELKALMAGGANGLVRLRGRWVEIDRDRCDVLAHWKQVQAHADGGISFLEGMRLLAGAPIAKGTESEPAEDTARERVIAGPWLAEQLAVARRTPGRIDAAADVRSALQAELRPYQEVGVRWLWLATRLGLGVCLADDMGLGKTVQVLALLALAQKQKKPGAKATPPHLLVVPASLVGNWQAELARFAPGLRALVAHPSVMAPSDLAGIDDRDLAGIDLVITTYSLVTRLAWLAKRGWSMIIVDEAQALKNPGAKQTRAVKSLRGLARVALTGTPVENRIGDLWSLFDFLNPGLLGSAREFGTFSKRLAERPDGHAPLRRLIAPYLLRRLKSDKNVIADLPDKTELKAFCGLAPAQAALYQQSVEDLRDRLAATGPGIERRGIVLAFLMRLKQICNHPAHWLGNGAWSDG